MSDRPFSDLWNWWGSLSRIARLSLRRELAAILPLTALMGVLNFSFCQFVGLKALGMSKAQLMLFVAVTFLGFLLAGSLTGSLQRVRKMKALAIVLVAVSAVLLTITITPIPNTTAADSLNIIQDPTAKNSLAVYIFLGQIFLAQIGMALVFTLRPSVWRANYPLRHRGKIVVLIELGLTLGASLAIFIYTSFMDWYNLPFQAIYVISAVFGLIAAWMFSRIRLRHEQSQIRSLVNNPDKLENKLLKPWAGLAVLGQDHKFRKYMSWQMLNGFSTMLIDMGLLAVLLVDVFDSSWTEGGAVLTAVPLIATGISSPVWGRFFDRRNIYTIRFYAALAWTLSRLVLITGIFCHSIAIVLVSRAVSGIAMGGGKLAWRLGHMEFAPPEKDSLYMGAHVSLTGLRGLLAPFIGIFLYQLEREYLNSPGLIVIALSAAGLFTAGLGFRSMYPKKEHPIDKS